MKFKDALYSEGDINIGENRIQWRNELSEKTKSLLAEDEKYFLHQSMSTPCLDVISACEGSYLINSEGRKILDFHGNSVHQVGFKNEYIIGKVKRQMDELTFCTRRYTNEPAINLAKKLVDTTGGRLNKVLFAPGGATANGMALKLARAVTGRFKVITFWDAFHGASLDTISVGGEAVFRQNMGPTMPGVERIPPPNIYRGILGPDEQKYIEYLRYVVEKEGDIGTLIAEPIRNTDVIMPSKSFWQQVRKICDDHGIFLILDEIPTGLGRTGEMFVFDHYGIVPDAVTLGKGLGGGLFPLAAMLTQSKYDVVSDISIGHYTHEKNPLAATAGLATLEFLEQHNVLGNVKRLEGQLCDIFNKWKNKYSIIGDIRGLGLLWAIELVLDKSTKEKAFDIAEKIMYSCLKEGVNFKVSQGNVIQLSPPLTISEEELLDGLGTIEKHIRHYSI